MFNVIQLFLTFRCSMNCSYCIQGDINRKSYRESDPDKWIKFLMESSLPRNIGLIGGEPTLYSGFSDVVSAIANKYIVTVTTNLKSPLFNDFLPFIEWASKYRNTVRWNTSFHPGNMDVDEYINKVKSMRMCGLWVDQVAAVYTKEIDQYLDKLLSANIGFWLQTNTYVDDSGEVHPNEKDLSKWGSGETVIHDINKYRYLCNGKKNDTVLCHTGKFLVDPSGEVYRCHRDIYKAENSMGNVFSEKDNDLALDFVCKNIGECNPCDVGMNYWRI